MTLEYVDSFCPHRYQYGDGIYLAYGQAADGCERSPATPHPTPYVTVADLGQATFEGFVPSSSGGVLAVVRFPDGRHAICSTDLLSCVVRRR